MKLAIRDDDLSYWTSVEEIDALYGPYFQKGMKISFAAVPNSLQLHHGGDRRKFYQGNERKPIYDNPQLVDYIKEHIRNGHVEIMQHGFDHTYCIEQDGKNVLLSEDVRKKVGETDQLVFVPECIHKDDKLLKCELKQGKEILEDTFGVKVSVFVPPSNALRAGAVNVIENLGMNISGTMLPSFNRKKDIYSVAVYLKKILWRIKNKEISYPYIMKYKNHKELTGYALTPSTNMKKLYNQLAFCEEHDLYGTIATHYWELLENEKLKADLYQILDNLYAENELAVSVSEIFN